MTVPYASATSGNRARQEVIKVLRRFGCEKTGFMDDDAKHEVILYFEHRGRPVRLSASAKGWAQMWLKENPLSSRARKSRHEHEQDALRQGLLAVSSILRDWIKGQVTAIETGILSFEAVFMSHMLTADGRPLVERLAESNLLPKPDDEKVVSLPRSTVGAAEAGRCVLTAGGGGRKSGGSPRNDLAGFHRAILYARMKISRNSGRRGATYRG